MSAPSRRHFLKQLVYSAFGTYLGFAAGACRRPPSGAPRPLDRLPPGKVSPPAPGYRFLTVHELETVSAACERLLPRDQDPGALDLGVPVHIDRALAADDLYRPQQQAFRGWLKHLDRVARERHGKRFHELDEPQQTAILASLEQGRRRERRMFRRFLFLTLEGAFGDPSYGGNREGRGWRMIGFRPSPPMPGMVMP